MTENAMLAIVFSVLIVSCTAEKVYDKHLEGKSNPVTACVKRAWTHVDRMECIEKGFKAAAPQEKK